MDRDRDGGWAEEDGEEWLVVGDGVEVGGGMAGGMFDAEGWGWAEVWPA